MTHILGVHIAYTYVWTTFQVAHCLLKMPHSHGRAKHFPEPPTETLGGESSECHLSLQQVLSPSYPEFLFAQSKSVCSGAGRALR